MLGNRSERVVVGNWSRHGFDPKLIRTARINQVACAQQAPLARLTKTAVQRRKMGKWASDPRATRSWSCLPAHLCIFVEVDERANGLRFLAPFCRRV